MAGSLAFKTFFFDDIGMSVILADFAIIQAFATRIGTATKGAKMKDDH